MCRARPDERFIPCVGCFLEDDEWSDSSAGATRCRDEQIEFETDLLRAMRADADRYVDERSDDEY